MALEIVAFSLLCIYHKQVCTLFGKSPEMSRFFTTTKLSSIFKYSNFHANVSKHVTFSMILIHRALAVVVLAS